MNDYIVFTSIFEREFIIKSSIHCDIFIAHKLLLLAFYSVNYDIRTNTETIGVVSNEYVLRKFRAGIIITWSISQFLNKGQKITFF